MILRKSFYTQTINRIQDFAYNRFLNVEIMFVHEKKEMSSEIVYVIDFSTHYTENDYLYFTTF